MACKVFGENHSLIIDDLLESLNNKFTLEDFMEEERRICMILVKLEICDHLPSNRCEEIMTNMGVNMLLTEEVIKFVSNMCLYMDWKHSSRLPMFELTL